MNPKKAKEFTGVGSTKYKGPKKPKMGPLQYQETNFSNKDIDTFQRKFVAPLIKDVEQTDSLGNKKMIHKPGKYKG